MKGREIIRSREKTRRIVSAMLASSLLILNIVAPICATKSNINKDTKNIVNTIEEIKPTNQNVVTVEIMPVTTSILTTATVTTTITTETTTTCTTEADEVIEEETTIYDDNEESETLETEEDSYYENDETYYGWFEATYYEGGYGTYGASGRDLISGYSIASNILGQGTLVRIVGSGLDGIYRVDDKGGMPDHVIDVYYQYGDTPDYFQLYGRMDIEVYVIG